MTPTLIASCLAWLVLLLGAPTADRPERAAGETVKVFILAGQSNMEGQAVVDLAGKDYNDGRGTLEWIASRPETAALVAHLRNPDGSWRTRDDVFVRYQPEGSALKAGPLSRPSRPTATMPSPWASATVPKALPKASAMAS